MLKKKLCFDNQTDRNLQEVTGMPFDKEMCISYIIDTLKNHDFNKCFKLKWSKHKSLGVEGCLLIVETSY